jgi:hypothetical protein
MNWKFQTITAGIEKQGIRDNDIQVFDKYRIASVVRESIQNSLDAVLDESKPVRVEFEYGAMQKNQASELFQIENHVKACLEGVRKGTEDFDLLSGMVGKIRENQNQVHFLKISDFNTIGMQKDGAYDAFAFSRNINDKQDESSLGSKGMGKSAFFSNSYLRTILVSSRFHSTGETLFQGISRLATHRILDHNYYFKGFFGAEDFRPASSPPLGILHHLFQRSVAGTTIGIIGVWEDFSEAIKEEFIKAIIKSFWLAIINKKLEIQVNGLQVDFSNVYDLCCDYWDDYQGPKTGENINPRQYIECYLGKVEHKKFEANIDFLGKVELTLGKRSEFNGMISFFRKSNMLIETKYRGNPNHSGYAGVFVCEDSKGNQLLKRLENPRHDQWSSKNYKDPSGKAALKTLEEFISNCYDEYFAVQKGNEITLSKLNDFIQIDHRRKSDVKLKTFVRTQKDIKVGVKQPAVGGGGEKRMFGLRCYAKKNSLGEWVYHVSFKGADYYPNVIFQVLVGGDNEKAGSDNIIPIIQLDGNLVEVETNRIETTIQKGENKFSFILKDEEKHSLNLKLI